MFYRRKIILAMLELLGGEVESLRFQKLLFLYTMGKKQPEYDFIPYKYGCYSYSAKADMNTMVKKGYLAKTQYLYKKEASDDYLQTLKTADRKLLQQVVSDYGQMSSSELIKHTYINFPFYATRSIIAKEVLTSELYTEVEKVAPKNKDITLFTIGYEGIFLEMYLQKLIRSNVKLLIDVRKNAKSMKFGFSKTLLQRYCNSLDIEYKHIPDVGIDSKKRKQLNTQQDYDQLFAEYRKSTLASTTDAQEKIVDLLRTRKRVALTCFEAEPCKCHRTHLAKSLEQLPDFNYPIINL